MTTGHGQLPHSQPRFKSARPHPFNLKLMDSGAGTRIMMLVAAAGPRRTPWPHHVPPWHGHDEHSQVVTVKVA
jgi:hypothetical protein